MTVVLIGIRSVIEFQCAHNALEHVEEGRRNTLGYETPDGPLNLAVTIEEGVVYVEKADSDD